MAELGHRHRCRVNTLRDQHESLCGAADDAVVGSECAGRNDLGVDQGRDDQSRRLGRLPDHPGELGQAGHTFGIDRTTQIAVVDGSARSDRVHPGHRLHGRTFPHRHETEQLCGKTNGSTGRGIPAAGRQHVGLVRTAFERGRRRRTQQQGLRSVLGRALA